MSASLKIHSGTSFRGRADTSVPTQLFRDLVENPAQPLSAADSDVIKSDESGTVLRWQMPAGSVIRAVAYKCASASGLEGSLRVLLGIDRATCGWKVAVRLRRLGISTPQPLMAIVPRFRTRNSGTYVVTEWMFDAWQVDHFIQTHSGRVPSWAHMERQAAEALGFLIGRLHRSSHMHRDLKVANLMLQPNPDGVVASFVDLDGIRRIPFISRRRRMKDLARLSVCFPDDVESRNTVRLRFLRAYLRALRGSETGWKCEWRKLDRATRLLRVRKLARDQRRFGTASAQENSPDSSTTVGAGSSPLHGGNQKKVA